MQSTQQGQAARTRQSPSTQGSHRPWQAGAVMLCRLEGGLSRTPAGLCPGTWGSVLQGMARSGLTGVPKCRGQHNNGDRASRRVSAQCLHARGAWSPDTSRKLPSPLQRGVKHLVRPLPMSRPFQEWHLVHHAGEQTWVISEGPCPGSETSSCSSQSHTSERGVGEEGGCSVTACQNSCSAGLGSKPERGQAGTQCCRDQGRVVLDQGHRAAGRPAVGLSL